MDLETIARIFFPLRLHALFVKQGSCLLPDLKPAMESKGQTLREDYTLL